MLVPRKKAGKILLFTFLRSPGRDAMVLSRYELVRISRILRIREEKISPRQFGTYPLAEGEPVEASQGPAVPIGRRLHFLKSSEVYMTRHTLHHPIPLGTTPH